MKKFYLCCICIRSKFYTLKTTLQIIHSTQSMKLRPLFLLLRPKTLTASAAPVLLALAAAYLHTRLHWLPALLCLSFALLMQMAANAINDLVDAQKGRDTAERIGPQRMAATGTMKFQDIRKVIFLLMLCSILVGLPLAYMGGWWLIALGALCMLFCVLYSTLLAGKAGGDVLVLIFFGLIPVTITYYLQTGHISIPVIEISLGMGMVTNLLLIVNNYRDIHQDRLHGKTTLVVLLGLPTTRILYLVLGLAAATLGMHALYCMGVSVWAILPLVYVPLHWKNFRTLARTPHGPMLNACLTSAAKGIIAYALILCAALIGATIIS